jgi:type IV secretory pathway VirB3-like protein
MHVRVEMQFLLLILIIALFVLFLTYIIIGNDKKMHDVLNNLVATNCV